MKDKYSEPFFEITKPKVHNFAAWSHLNTKLCVRVKVSLK